MQARGLLMIEHRLIERMLSVIKNALAEIVSNHKVDPVFVDLVVDFFRVYADRTHHGKEEDILFRELNKKALSQKDRQLMKELIEEHVFGRHNRGEQESVRVLWFSATTRLACHFCLR